MNKSELQEIRQSLEQKYRIMQSEAGYKGTTVEAVNPDRSDLAQNYEAGQRNRLLYSWERDQITQIEAALQRLDEGNYGICVTCGEKIPIERLKVLPVADLCIDCKLRQEA